MTLHAILKRLRTGDDGTFGTLRVIGADGAELSLCTGELPWRENARGVSCIPAGSYRAYIQHSPSFGRNLYELAGVPGRSEILIHHGNFCGDRAKGKQSDVRGCILVGVQHGTIHGQRAVIQSRVALSRLHAFCKGAALEIEVVGPPG